MRKYSDHERFAKIGPRMSADRVISTLSAGKIRRARKARKVEVARVRNALPVTRKPLSAKNIGTSPT